MQQEENLQQIWSSLNRDLATENKKHIVDWKDGSAPKGQAQNQNIRNRYCNELSFSFIKEI